ncbi:SDR family oxidoreductase [Nonomuraea africana]|uniref:NAD(P)-dependent dehydrogenase (Short-subunit alcohol dehydrogenase family) n=1 Tax=Nonomuraea africana TaxID=46171 RepID=A0ABR9KBN1_9ACTN|nr:SDR family oxidoreductase [Nonomuraea africana]MBE1559123.1 NAD(P)-dependent dehydrogenase (short-subunit alcohol dehydrogenase family) [Nonomuraea africana]
MAESMIALVTGANKGIGLEIVRSLAGHGVTVLLGARDSERRDKATAALRADGLDVHPIALDVTDPATIRAATAHIDERFGHLDVLVNNAGTSGGVHHPPSEANLDIVREVFDTNVFGVIRVTNAMLPLLKRSAAGRVINVSSGLGSMTQMTDADHYVSRLPAQVDYPASKAALNALTVQYARELREHGIAVNAVAPGLCATDFNKELGFPIARTAAEGAAIAVRLATLEGDGPTGGFFDDNGEVPW